jgi:outer membrane protein OmpA-like peptidoglycan-associated protein
VAGGSYKDGSGNTQAFVSVYDGSAWVDHEVVGSLNVQNYAYVNSVSCTSSSSCVAGGQYQDGNGKSQAFVSVYNGSTWTDHEIAASLNIGNGYVNSVSCTANGLCVAGGQYTDGSNNRQAFVSVYNGSTWTDQELAGSINVGFNAAINSVSCASNTSCVAIGSYSSGISNFQAFVSVYNGNTWVDQEVAGSLNVGNDAGLNSVSCASSTSCVAGGIYLDVNNHYQAFVSVYNGNTWVDQEVAELLNLGNYAWITSLSCTSSTSCVLGGFYIDGSNHRQAFVSVYNGSTWVDQEVAGLLNVDNYASVNSVSCTSSTSCVAGGSYPDGNNHYQAFVSVYNGSTWADQEVAGLLNAQGAEVSSVSCTSSGLCLAGGSYRDSGNNVHALVSSTTLPVAHARVSGTVYFASASSTLSATAKQTLNALAAQIVSQNQSSVTLNGYTDPLGSMSTNIRLSTQRANSVKNFLKSKLTSLGDSNVAFVLHGRGVTQSGAIYAKDRKVTLS